METKNSSNEGMAIEVNDNELPTQNPVTNDYGAVLRPSRINRIGGTNVKDHFSLANPSSTIAFADEETLLFVDNLEQVTLLKKKDDDYVTAKQATVSSPGLLLTRVLYTLVALLMAGCVFVLCIQIVLFLFLGLAIESGLTSQKGLHIVNLLGTLFSIPVLITALSQAMVLANTFVIDTWKGSKFMKTIVSWDSTMADWVSHIVFLGLPLFTASVALFSGSEEWWTITTISWFCLVFVYYVVFSLTAIYYEIDGCLELVRYHPKLCESHKPDSGERSMVTFVRAIKFRMKQMLSGYTTVSYVTHSTDPNPKGLSYDEVMLKESFQSSTGLFSRLTRLEFMSPFYTVLDTPVREYSVDEVLEFTPFITRSSWGLESIYCRQPNTQFIAIIDGISAITTGQVTSSIACFAYGTFITIFAFAGFLVWAGLSASGVVVVVVLSALASYSRVNNRLDLRSAHQTTFTQDDGDLREINRTKKSHALYQVKETFRISEPKPIYWYILLWIAIGSFYIFPAYALFNAGNNRVGSIFIVAGIVTVLRNIFNAPSVLREVGSLEGIEVNNVEKNATSEWREKHRLGKIVGEISAGPRSNFWIRVFLFFVVIFCAIFLSAITLGVDDGVSDNITFAPKEEFYYEGSSALDYAACAMAHNIKTPDGRSTTSLADFAFLSAIAYLDDNAANNSLGDWFGSTVTENLSQRVTDFKEVYQNENGVSSVSYKLLNFPDQDLHIVAVRGTSNSWDALSDAQLWSSAALVQYVRAILPLGEIWTPVLPHLVKVISMIEDKSLKEVSYYRETTAFVESLKEEGFNVQIVGHSLGGGLAMITGAQTQIPAVGLSGPNNMISRKTFHPEISEKALNKYTFNIIPDRDPVPRIDDLAKNYQRIECRAAPNRPVDCHFGRRSLCEILLTCGSSQLRPIPCFCVNEYGYELPISANGLDFNGYC